MGPSLEDNEASGNARGCFEVPRGSDREEEVALPAMLAGASRFPVAAKGGGGAVHRETGKRRRRRPQGRATGLGNGEEVQAASCGWATATERKRW
ncbi:hypothetical protein U9M48_036996 [Paspalum notatum var. saurae]|uniref:DUF834 domain-containing protein n=1 Tax=Paspalum notatum var. saurae TaxID=547442 RepID=A0AAQ3XBY4_PASNO